MNVTDVIHCRSTPMGDSTDGAIFNKCDQNRVGISSNVSVKSRLIKKLNNLISHACRELTTSKHNIASNVTKACGVPTSYKVQPDTDSVLFGVVALKRSHSALLTLKLKATHPACPAHRSEHSILERALSVTRGGRGEHCVLPVSRTIFAPLQSSPPSS